MSIFSAPVDKEKPSPPSLSSALAALKGGLSHLASGDGLRALRNLLYMQPLAMGNYYSFPMHHVEKDVCLFSLYSASCWVSLMIIK